MSNDFWSTLNKKKKEELLKSTQTKQSSTTREETKSSDFWSVLNEDKKKELLSSATTNDAPMRTFMSDDDIAPVKGGNKDSIFKSGGFSDGVDGVGDFFGDLGQTVLGTTADLGIGILKGAGRLVEGVADLGTYGVAGVADLFGADEFAEKTKKVAQYNATDEWTKGATDYVDQYSVLGNKADMVSEGIGQVGAIILTGGLGAAGGLSSAGATALTTGLTFASGMGSGMNEAYESGASDGKAFAYGATAGTVEAVSELIFGGLGKGVKALGVSKGLTSIDDVVAKKISNAAAKYITSEAGQKVVGNALEYAVKSGAEGLEEVISGFGSAIAKDVYLMNGEDEKAFGEILKDEKLLEQFVVGSIVSGIAQGGDFIKSTKNGRDFVSGLSNNEQTVVDKVYEQRLAEESKNKTLSNKDKNKLYDSIVEQMEKGYISTDTIEEVLGGDEYKTYKDNLDTTSKLKTELEDLSNIERGKLTRNQEKRIEELEAMNLNDTTKSDELRKKLDDKLSPMLNGSKLAESYRETERRKQAFTADLTKYTGKQKEAIQRAIDSGVLNNTNRSHELVDILSKIEADKGIAFDYTNNEKLKETGFAVEGKTVNGFVKDGGVTLNVQSQKAWQSTVGHEITHVLEGTESYGALREALYAYAESKGELESRRTSLAETYNGMDADIDAELTADLVGDYLFSDKDFINHLTGNRSLFQKVYDEIKYLCKVATGKELTEIEKVKREFDRAWKEQGQIAQNNELDTEFDNDDVNYSISVTDSETLNFLDEQVSRGEYNAETNPDGGYYVTYKSMSFWGYDEDGNAILRSPMAEYVDGELSNAYLVPKDKSKLNWYKSTETIDENTGLPTGLLVKAKKDGNNSFSYLPAAENQDLINEDWSNLYFNLRKKVLKNGKWVNSDVPARYNPYEHSSNSMLNDQFSAAYLRDNLVTVKMYVPVSEDNGTFRAKYSKDATGWADWKTGTVAGKINKQKDLQRKVYLSRYAAPVEIVPDSEVAQAYKEYLEGTDVTIPDNVVSPNLLNELKKAGVPIEESGKVKYSLSKDIENFDNSWYNEIELPTTERDRVQSEALTWHTENKGQPFSMPLSNGFTYLCSLDNDGIVHIYGKEKSVNIHEFGGNYDNRNTERPDRYVEKFGNQQGIDISDNVFDENGQDQIAPIASNGTTVQGEGRSNRTGYSKNDTYAYRKPKAIGWHLNDDGSVEVTYSDGTKEIEYPTPKKRASSSGGVFFDEENTDVRFSLSKSVEETKDLVAIHNLKSSELTKTLELGGLPMPSIAVIKAEQGHEQYGDVSLVFPKDAIDPKKNRANKVYGGDAWTPTYPKIEYKPNKAVEQKIINKYSELARRVGYDEVRPLSRYADGGMEDTLNHYGGEEEMLKNLYDDTRMMQLYLIDTGKGKVDTIQKEIRTELSDVEVETNEFFINELGADIVDAVMVKDGGSPTAHRKQYWEEHGEKIKETYKKFLTEHGLPEDVVQNVIDATKTLDYLKYVRNAYLYRKNGRVTTKTEADISATEEAIRKSASEGYREWVDSLFKGIQEKTGIRNNEDYFTRSGNRRSWDALHWENTLENVVRVMKQKNQTGADAIFGAHQIFATSAKEYGSIAEIKADSNRLYKMSEEEYEAVKDSYTQRMSDIASRIMDKGERNQFIALDNAMECIVDAVRTSKTKEGIYKELKQYNQLTVTEQDVEDITSLVTDISNMPTGYFEAKPQRAVGFDEVGVFVIPRNADVKLKQELLNRGYSIAEYDPDVEGDRQKVVNSFEEYKFSLSNVGEQFAPIGNYSTPLNETALEQDIAPVADVAENAPKQTAEDTTFDAPMFENIPVLPDEELEQGTIAAIRPKPEKQPSLKKVNNAESEEHIAQVLTEEPKVEKKKTGIIKRAIANLIDKGAVFENLSLKTKNRALQDTYKAMGRSETKAQYFMENGTKGIKSLDSIREEVEQTGKTKEFYEYLYHKLNIDRMSLESKEQPNLQRLQGEMKKLKLDKLQENQLRAIASEKITEETAQKRADLIKTVREYLASKDVKNKPVFDYSVTSEMSQDKVNELESANPNFKEYAQDVYNYMNHLRKMMVDKGVISQETADLWSEMYPHYVPIRRVGHEGLAVNVPLDTGRTGINAPIKKATGGNSDILPLFETMAQRTSQTFKAIDKNSFGVELKNTLGNVVESTKTNIDEVIDSIDAHESLLQEGKNGKNPTFTVFEGGERVTFEITDEMYDALKPTSEGLSYTNKVLNTASNLHRGVLTEYSVPFMVTNAIKDAQDVLINSQHPVQTYANSLVAIKELTTKGKWYTEYMENGGGDNTYFDKQTNTFNKEKSALRKVIGFPLDKISDVNNFIEKVPRLAEYIASRKSGASIDAAMLDAARVTTDFSAGGDVTKFLNRNGATFLNASVQGFAQQVRNVREAKANGLKGWLGLATKYAIAGLPALLLNHLLWEDDEEYEELSDYVKENYYVVAKYGDGKFVRIPKGRTLAVIQNAFEQISNTLTGDDEADFGRFFELFLSNLAPNNPLDNNIIAPIKQVMENKTWYGEDLVPSRLQDLPAAEQFDESTDAISKWLGENINVSPYKINYLLNQYSGGIGDIFLPMMTPEAESGDNSLLGNLIAPLKDKFTTDSVMNNQNVSDFYDTVDELTANAKSSYATEEDILKYKYINSVNSDLGDLYKAKREIQNSSLSDAVKYAKVREIQKQINALAKESLYTYSNVSSDDNYANVGDKHYKLNNDGEWQKISDEQVEKQAPFVKVYGGYSSYLTYSSDLYAIKADKDESGKSISGSRKEKVLNYINNLDADYETKIILWKSEYPSDDTYNMEIINYINNRTDLTYEERVSIFTELGFTVSNGSVYWD